MDETFKAILLSSSLLNLLFIGRGIVLLARRKGSPWSELQLKPMTAIPYYCDKVNHFKTLPNSESAIVFLGDSLTDYCEWTELFAGRPIQNRGISGDRTDGLLQRLDEALASKPQKIFLMIGINDLVQGREVGQVVSNYRLILEEILGQFSKDQLFIQSVLPINGQVLAEKLGISLSNDKVIELNTNLKELANEFSLHYIDLFPAFLNDNNELDTKYTTDGVHLNGQGYLVWKKCLENVVN